MIISFSERPGAPLTRVLALLLLDLGGPAGLDHCHPHRLWQPIAAEYFRNGGDVFTLRMILGHASLEMVKTYAKVAAMELKKVHQRASPADRWRL
jgi:site-specific recombinase XerD